MNQIIQNIKEYSAKSFDLVLSNKALSMGIAAFVVLSILGGLYLYSSYSRPEIKQMGVVEASIASRISEVLTKMSFAQKLSSVLTAPLLAIAYKLYTTVEHSSGFVYRMRTEVPTRLQIILFCTASKYLLIGFAFSLLFYPFSANPTKPAGDGTAIWVNFYAERDATWDTKIHQFLMNVIPYFIQRHLLFVSMVYNFIYRSCAQIILLQQRHFEAFISICFVLKLIHYFEIPYLYGFGALVRYYLSRLTNFGFFSKLFVPLCVNTYEDRYLCEELISSKLVKSEGIFYPWSSVPSLE